MANVDSSGSKTIPTAEDYPRTPMWTPLGDKIVYTADNVIRMVDVSNNADNLLFDLDVILPAWSTWSTRASWIVLSPDKNHLAVGWHGIRAQAMGGDQRDDPPPSGIILIDYTSSVYRGYRELEGTRNKKPKVTILHSVQSDSQKRVLLPNKTPY